MEIKNFLESALSPERLQTYRAGAHSDDHAWALYRWNLDLVAALTPMLCDFEVTLRNTIHRELTELFKREDWWAHQRLWLDAQTHANFEPVIQRHRKKLEKGSVGPGRVVADLTLGVWVQLLSKGAPQPWAR